MPIKVLWFDDEHETFEAFKNKAQRNDILLEGVANAQEGLERLQSSPMHFDAILLDGLFFTTAEKNLDDVTQDAFGMVAIYLNENKKENLIPWFIYSGQPSFVRDNNSLVNTFAKESFGRKKVYDKNEPEDEQMLWEDIKSATGKIETTRLKLKHKDAYEIFSNGYLDSYSEEELLKLQLQINKGHTFDYPRNDFNVLRKFVEKLVDLAYQKKLIPMEIGNSNLTHSVNFLCNCHDDYNLKEPYFHSTLNFFLPNLLNILQDGSHSKVGMRYKADEYAVKMNNGYFFQTCVFQMLDVLIAFNRLFKKEETGGISQPYWKQVEFATLYEGILEQDSGKNYFCGEYLVPYKEVTGKLELGQKIRVLVGKENTNDRTRNTYRRFAERVELA